MMRHPDPAANWAVYRIRSAAEQKPEHPAAAVTWHDAIAYATWRGKRLPTVLEWERAARGTDGRSFPWGNEFDPSRCNSVESNRGQTTAVRAHPAGCSPVGCYDMAGNVFEWLQDWSPTPRHSPLPNSEKANRGGSYRRQAADLMCWYEESDPPWMTLADVGFRCAWTSVGTGSGSQPPLSEQESTLVSCPKMDNYILNRLRADA
jgi:formylglycine-generating enzyme required for sulfatase activity